MASGEGIYETNKDPGKVNAFLNLYYGKEVKLTAIMQACNQFHGTLYWIYIYEEEDTKDAD